MTPDGAGLRPKLLFNGCIAIPNALLLHVSAETFERQGGARAYRRWHSPSLNHKSARRSGHHSTGLVHHPMFGVGFRSIRRLRARRGAVNDSPRHPRCLRRRRNTHRQGAAVSAFVERGSGCGQPSGLPAATLAPDHDAPPRWPRDSQRRVLRIGLSTHRVIPTPCVRSTDRLRSRKPGSRCARSVRRKHKRSGPKHGIEGYTQAPDSFPVRVSCSRHRAPGIALLLVQATAHRAAGCRRCSSASTIATQAPAQAGMTLELGEI